MSCKLKVEKKIFKTDFNFKIVAIFLYISETIIISYY